MGALNILEIVANFTQYIGVIGSIKITWPPGFEWIGNHLRFLRIDFSIPLPNVSIPALDYRSQLILLTNALPLVIAIVLLIFFKSLPIVVWACLIIGGIGLIFAGIVLLALPTSQFSIQSSIAQYLLIGGICLELIIVTVHAVLWYQKRQRKLRANRVVPFSDDEAVDEDEAVEESPKPAMGTVKRSSADDDDEEEEAPNVDAIKTKDRAARKPFLQQLAYFLLGAVLTAIGIIVNSLVDTSRLREESSIYSVVDLWLKTLGSPLGWTSFAFGLAILYLWFTALFVKTRRFNERVKYLFRKNVVRIVLLALSLFYIPMTTAVLSAFMCSWVAVPQGSEFVHRSVSLEFNSILTDFTKTTYNGTAVNPCYFRADQCPIADKLCPATQDLRLVADPSLSCTAEIYPFYLPGALISLVTIVIGIPWLYYKLIRVSARFVSELPTRSTDPTAKWKEQCALTSSSCRSLYTMFEVKWKYYKLVTLVHKLLIVAVLIFGNSYSFALICALTATHSLFALTSMVSRPYVRVGEDALATVCLLVNVGNAVVALLIALNFYVPSWAAILVAGLNLVFPTAALCIGFYIERKEAAAKEAEREEREKRRQQRDGLVSSPKSGDDADSDGVELEEEDAPPVTDYPGSDEESVLSDAAKRPLSPSELDFVDSMDQELDLRLLRILVNSFLLLGFGAFVGAAIAIVGVLYATAAGNMVRPLTAYGELTASTGTSAAQIEFAGYANWTQFTANCCCQASLATDAGTGVLKNNTVAQVAETWKCFASSPAAASVLGGNGFMYKTRVRRVAGIDGLMLRPYCSTAFNASAVVGLPAVNATSGLVQVKAAADTAFSAYQLTYLW
ncbi:hypothetical protein H9P43_007580 [Blastocladiella emersonii ATCC 22665]|nr:hypothetical protein H9P43_007580 [Blastocladiella emersonii ATCC 22665]